MVYGIIKVVYGNAGYRNGGRYRTAACVFGNAIALYYGVCKTESAYFGLVMDGVALYRVNKTVADKVRYGDMIPLAVLIRPVEEYQIAAAGSVVPACVIGEVAEVVGIILDTGIAGVAYDAGGYACLTGAPRNEHRAPCAVMPVGAQNLFSVPVAVLRVVVLAVLVSAAKVGGGVAFVIAHLRQGDVHKVLPLVPRELHSPELGVIGA